MRTRLLVALMSLALLLLSACTGGSGASGSRSPSASQSPPSPASSTPEVPLDDEGILDPCTMVPRDYVEALVPEERRDQVVFDRELGRNLTVLTRSDTTRYSCNARFGDTGRNVLSWGYFPESFSVTKVENLLTAAGGTDVTAKVGFTAALTGDILSSEAYGLMHDDVGIFVFVDESIDSLAGKEERTAPKVMLAHLKEVGRGAYYASTQRPIDTPSYCPEADSSEVRAAFGRVDVARGAQDVDGRISCLYRNEKDFSNLTLTGNGSLDQDDFDAHYEALADAEGEGDLLEGPNGTLTSVIIGNDGQAEVRFADPGRSLWIETVIDYVSEQRRPRRDQGALVSLTEAFETLLPKT